MQTIIDIIKSIDSNNSNINPTQIYNEGWMARLLMIQSIREGIVFKGINFANIFNWTSEALISSPFINTKQNREGYTHADIVFGDFEVNFKESGKIIILDTPKIFGIIEAKMKSGLSTETKNFQKYNQASRSLLCIGNNTYNKKCKTFFIVVAPLCRLDKIKKDTNLKILHSQINNRYIEHKDDLYSEEIITKAKNCNVMEWSYEEWIGAIEDGNSKEYLNDFYKKTLIWNRLIKE